LMVQLRIPTTTTTPSSSLKSSNKETTTTIMEKDRYVCLFVCPRTECFEQLHFDDKGFASNGQGLLKCIEQRLESFRDTANGTPTTTTTSISTPIPSSWYDDGKDDNISNHGGSDDNDNDDDDWVIDGTDGDINVVALEKAVAAMEKSLDENGMLLPGKVHPSKQSLDSEHQQPITNRSEALLNEFDCYLLKEQNEPLPTRPMLEEDDVGLADSDEKIRNMLARYMAEEDDEDILAALRGTEIGGSGGGSGKKVAAEEDERLSDEDRILRGFQDRLRRLPRQVVRYARGGTPLWSIPDKSKKSGKPFWNVPDCEFCGQTKKFEFQVLPSILETLDVDRVAGINNTEPAKNMGLDDLLSSGMNFGSIAVFTCDNGTCQEIKKDSSLVIQRSVDDMNSMKKPSESFLPLATMAVVENLDDDDEFELDH
jgi:pre-rRNA-processing protein TSR4